MERLQHLGEPPEEVLSVLFELTDSQQEKGEKNKEQNGKAEESSHTAEKGLGKGLGKRGCTSQNVDEKSKNEKGDKDSRFIDEEIKSLLKNFEDLVFDKDDEKKQTDRRDATSNDGTTTEREDEDEEENCDQEDIQGFLRFLKGLGLSGNETEKFLNPEILIKTAMGEVSENELVQMILGNGLGETNKQDTSRKPEGQPKSQRNAK